jgi:3-phenylpropionate/cinnamic acid dioxygenase small subunit
MRLKSHQQKTAAKEDRKVLRRRILKVLEGTRTYTESDNPRLRHSVALRVAALVRELEETR